MSTFRYKQLIITGLCFLPVLSLTSCTKKEQSPLVITEKKVSLADVIRDRGAQIVVQGSRLQIILPTDKFFRLQTIELKESQIDTLKLIAIYLKQFLREHHVEATIYIRGYTDTVFTKETRQSLSKQYATVVASFLWNQGFSRDQLRVQGHGAKNKVGSAKTSDGSAANRRVVIQVN